MLTVTNVSMNFSGQTLFKDVDLKFTQGNCYGIIGANGAGKSTFLRILSGDLEPTTGEVSIRPNTRMSVLKQDHFAYDEFTVLDTVIQGNMHLYEVMKEKDAIYAKEDFTDEDGIRASELEAEFAEMNGWDVETDIGKLLNGLGLSDSMLYDQMSTLTAKQKVKILLAQALFGNPEIILLDEPTNHLDIKAIEWLEDFIMEYPGTILVVSHDRHFLNTVCTNIVDVDYGGIKMFVGNYEFWYESCQLMQKLLSQQKKKREDKIAELQEFISRFSANKSKSKQATARRKLLDKISIEEIPVSSRKYPYVGFKMDREPGKEILIVENVSKTIDGKKILDNVSFRVHADNKIAFVGENEIANTTLFKIIVGELEPDEGTVKWGITISHSYLPLDNSEFFDGNNMNLVEWLGQYTDETTETFMRGFLGRMLFSGDEVYKQVKVLSGGEKMRCMLARMMLYGANFLVLDQPTNHLDLESISAVNDGLKNFDGNVIFSSHDHEFIQTVANRIMEISPEGKLTDKLCTYDEYIGEA
ncbi:MAG: ATP-binding cassette domain-containing protein [Clostridia bacterium]|nr:ATP-binding cassette domain-containing protein [Clostridia bacterium]